MDDDERDFHQRLSKLETLMETVGTNLKTLQEKLDAKSKINWAPIAIGVSIFFTIGGSIATVYNSKIDSTMEAVTKNDSRLSILEKIAAERGIEVLTHEERIRKLERDIEFLEYQRDGYQYRNYQEPERNQDRYKTPNAPRR